MGPLMLAALLSVTSAVLVVLPTVKPVTPELKLRPDDKVCADPKLLLASKE